MISRIEAQGFRCFRNLDQRVEPLQILVGPNGSGKSNFLDIVAFLGTSTDDSVRAAIEGRSEDFRDLVWGRQGTQFRIAIEAVIPEERRVTDIGTRPDTIRYETIAPTRHGVGHCWLDAGTLVVSCERRGFDRPANSRP